VKLGYNSIKTLGCGLYVTHGVHESSQGRGAIMLGMNMSNPN